MSTFGVRAHTRKGKNGERINVSQHSKSGKGARPGRRSLARRAWGNTKKAWRAGRRKQKWMAAGFAALAVVEVSAYVALQTTAFALVTLAAAAVGTALLANVLAGGKGTNR